MCSISDALGCWGEEGKGGEVGEEGHGECVVAMGAEREEGGREEREGEGEEEGGGGGEKTSGGISISA